MKRSSALPLVGIAGFAPLVAARGALAAATQTTSAADRAFVAKVSQGGMYEVEASKVARQKAVARDVNDVGVTEVHDHELVGAKLKSIATTLGLPFPSALNAAFAARLAKLESLSGPAFDRAYIVEMDAIHAIDVKAFEIEAASGTNPALRAFATETVVIVKRHIGALHAVPLPVA